MNFEANEIPIIWKTVDVKKITTRNYCYVDDKIVFSEKQFDGRMKENGEPCLLFNVKSNDFSDEINLKRYK